MPLTAHCFFKSSTWTRRDFQPPFQAIQIMLGELEASLRRAGQVPAGLRCETFRVPDRPDGMDRMAVIAIDATPGELHAPLRQWFQWQHPRWINSHSQPPSIEGSITVMFAP